MHRASLHLVAACFPSKTHTFHFYCHRMNLPACPNTPNCVDICRLPSQPSQRFPCQALSPASPATTTTQTLQRLTMRPLQRRTPKEPRWIRKSHCSRTMPTKGLYSFLIQMQAVVPERPNPAPLHKATKPTLICIRRSWIGGIFNKLTLKPKNQMILPDDKDPTVSICLCAESKGETDALDLPERRSCGTRKRRNG